ncbi:MAG: hypothetical protein HS108_12660 [Planctomycetes bacterium]|jgi:hypothetical protein|nr:hypothetical protein [Planctomycetota bacterium]MCL4729586.1 hypothetical protein [Planctomycetota bacterium]
MNSVRLPALAAAVAFLITALYAVDPGPYAMAAFVFLAQPLFVIAGAGYAYRVWKDLRGRKVL